MALPGSGGYSHDGLRLRGSLSGCTVGAYKSYEETAELLSDVQVDVEVKTASFREYVDACWENYAPSLMGKGASGREAILGDA